MGNLVSRLLSGSPFGGIEEMVTEINQVVPLLHEVFKALEQGDSQKLANLHRQIFDAEGKIDGIRLKIRNSISKTIFLPASKRDLIDLILTMDNIPDRIESLSETFLYRKLSYPESLQNRIQPILKIFSEIHYLLSELLLEELKGLMESSFTGVEAEGVKLMIHDISDKVHQSELLLQQAMKEVFVCENSLHSSEVTLWLKVIERLEATVHAQEKTSNTILRMIEN